MGDGAASRLSEVSPRRSSAVVSVALSDAPTTTGALTHPVCHTHAHTHTSFTDVDVVVVDTADLLYSSSQLHVFVGGGVH